MPILRRTLVIQLVLTIVLMPLATTLLPEAASAQNTASDSGAATLTQTQLLQLVAPIALYPDPLVGQILAASTNPMEVVEAARWLKDNSTLTGTQLTSGISSQGWDSSVQSLAQVPSVIENMNKNLSWTSALGDAYTHQSQDVMNAIQVLRGRAQSAGTLKTTPQQTVSVAPAETTPTTTTATTTTVQTGSSQTTVVSAPAQTIIIEPSNPQVIYVPSYNPTTSYGEPVAPYPGYSSADLMLTGLMSFGLGMMVGSMMSSGGGWGCNWHGGTVVYNHNTYVTPHNIYSPNGSNYWHHQQAYNNYAHNQQVNHRQQGVSNYEQHHTEQNRQQAYNNYESKHGGSSDHQDDNNYGEHHDNNPASSDRWNGYQSDRSDSSSHGNAFAGGGTPAENHSWSQRGAQSYGGGGWGGGGFGHRR